MESIANIERDCNAISNLFQVIINDMKGSSGNWEDLVIKATKFHTQLKATITASTAFLDAFQRIADLATSTRGGTKEIGSALTRLCLRHRSVEAKLKTFTSSLMDCLVLPLQDRLEEWKKTTNQLDKDHSKEMKRLKSELKKGHHLLSSSSTLKSKRRMKGRSSGSSFASGSRSGSISSTTGSMSTSMSSGMESVEGSEKLFLLEEMEKRSLRRALIEERSRFCLLVNFLRPVIEEELAMIHEINYLEEIMDNLALLTTDPYILPPSSELVISDHLKLNSLSNIDQGEIYANYKSWSEMNVNEANSPPSSAFGSRKNSMCSISSFASNSNSDGRSDSPSSVIYASTGGHRRSQQRGGSAPRCHSLSARGYEESDHYRETGHRSQRDSHRHPSATNGTVIPICVPTLPTTPSNKISPQEQVISNQSGGQSINYRSRNSYSTNSSPTIHCKQPDFRQMGQGTSNLARSSISVIQTDQCDRSQYDQVDSRGQSSYPDSRARTMYANSGSGDWTSSPGNNDTAYSEGSITPTNPERSVSPLHPDGQYNDYARHESQRLISSSSSSSVSSAAGHPSSGHYHSGSQNSSGHYHSGSQSSGHYHSGSQSSGQSYFGQKRQPVVAPSLPARNITGQSDQTIYSSTGTLRKEKPPPLPPVRRTSAISDPNAITLGTLKSTGCSTYEEVKRKSTLRLNEFGMEDDPIYSNLNTMECGETKNSKTSNGSSNSSSHPGPSSVPSGTTRIGSYPTDHDRISAILQKHHRPSPASGHGTDSKTHGISTIASILGNPDTSSGVGSGRLTNVHKDFMQSLNDKLSIPVSQRMSPKLTKRRSMSVGEHEWDSDSGIVTLERDRDSVGDRSNPNSATSSISSNSNPLQQSLMRLMSSSLSTNSSTNSRPSSATSHQPFISTGTETYTAFTITTTSGANTAPIVSNSSSHSHPVAINSSPSISTSSASPSINVGGSRMIQMVDPTMEIAKAAADIAKKRIQRETEQSSSYSPITSTDPPSSDQLHQSGQQGTYSATPVKVVYSPTHQPSIQPSIIDGKGEEIDELSGRNQRPLPQLPPNQRPGSGGQRNVTSSGPQVKMAASLVVINASNRHQQFAATHHPSLDIKVPSDASIHSSHSIHNGSIVSMKRGSLPAVMHRPSPGHVLSEAIGSFENAITSRVNNWLSTASGLSSRSGSIDLATNLSNNLSNCKETLMDQIKKGIQLRKTPVSSPVPVSDSQPPSPGCRD